MSRNLGRKDCKRCGEMLARLETPRQITKKEAGHYFNEFSGRLFAKVDCPLCGAHYLGWYYKGNSWDFLLYDISFYSTFDDEPEDADLPAATIFYPSGSFKGKRRE